ncbi:YidC/Oxa1 family membrane protein insertase [Epibacterium ulvae]|nr:PEP/pyruvate-binding domain-containing protein [Epibacterium ulvae]MBT8156105.1 YidC/Oxa1 family membrane protein insertase [Epibacterium ulvae]
MVSGLGAAIAAKFGFAPRKGAARQYPMKLIAGLTLVVIALLVGNYWQYTSTETAKRARLEATLLRPAQFEGSQIKDANLKETSFSAQLTHPQGISTEDAAALLASGTTRFFDVRETGENEMGTLPGSQHVRFPDFRESVPVAPGEQVVLFCHNGNRSSETCAELAKLGIDCRFVAGGLEKWIVEGRPFSDTEVRSLSDLRALPEYPNKDALLDTTDFNELYNAGDLQIIDTRYPGDFESGHLPGAINIPIRAITTSDLQARIDALQQKTTVAACYDRRSCFMAQALGLELTRKGIDYQGRYTLPWEFFVPPKPKAHVQDWLSDQNSSLWDKAIAAVAAALVWSHAHLHLLAGLFALSLLTRLLVLPIALKSERDQLTTAATKDELTALKKRLSDDPVRKARAIQGHYAKHGLTPMRNMMALAFLPIMMLGVTAAGQAATTVGSALAWTQNIGLPDPYYIMPVAFSALAAVYLLWAVAKTPRARLLWIVLGVPVLFAMVVGLSFAANAYLCFSLALLLAQRAYVVEAHKPVLAWIRTAFARMVNRSLPQDIHALRESDALTQAGNKAYRLSVMQNAGLPVPGGVVVKGPALDRMAALPLQKQQDLAAQIWKSVGERPCAVRSSASNEDGAEQSFAGVFDSVLDVTGDTMRDALTHVHHSFTSDRSKSYGDEGDSGVANVLVQEMVDAELAGVLFTQDPTAPGMIMLEWVKGNGEALVSGRVTPEVARFGRYTGQEIAETTADTPDFAPLLELGRKIEALFGAPQDVEWAYQDGQFRILQSRDITTLALGTPEQQQRSLEWHALLDRFAGSPTDEVLLEQDEMSEVLPRPTRMSFDLMNNVWAPGGSLDHACRALNVPYKLQEEPGSHLVNLFGKTFVDTRIKSDMALSLSAGQAKQLRKRAGTFLAEFQSTTLPAFKREVLYWQALDFDQLPHEELVKSITKMRDQFVQEIYVEAEKVNILATFTQGEAQTATAGDAALRAHLMQAEAPHSPPNLLASCEGDIDKALQVMGHRSMFDYELSAPRYREAPSLLQNLVVTPVQTIYTTPDLPAHLPEPLRQTLEHAIAFQDLKEQAKHEALRVLAELRRALISLGKVTGLEELIFCLTLDELIMAEPGAFAALKEIAADRKAVEDLRRKSAPGEVALTLQDMELLSMGRTLAADDGTLGGTCVAGGGTVTGRVFRVSDDFADDGSDVETLFQGFRKGDILVCQMVHPAWLPQVLQSGAVLSEVGGWLSHMSIVAREKNKMMLVSCKGLRSLHPNQLVTVSDSGEIVAELEEDATVVHIA